MEASSELILLGGLLLLLSVFAGMVSARLGAPLLLAFLGLGMLAGEDGPGHIRFGDFRLSYLIGSAALIAYETTGPPELEGAGREHATPSTQLSDVGE